MNSNHVFFGLALLCASTVTGESRATEIELVTIGDAGNESYPYQTAEAGVIVTRRAGNVDYEFRLGKYEITQAQYLEFLNAVDPEGLNELGLFHPSTPPLAGDPTFDGCDFSLDVSRPPGQRYALLDDSAADFPVWGVTWYAAARFCNWLHHGKGGPGSTEGDATNGAYDTRNFDDSDVANDPPTHNPGARFWLPTLDEWFKAAYFKRGAADAGYWTGPFRADGEPKGGMPSDDPVMSNAFPRWQDPIPPAPGRRVPVGSYPNAQSPYGMLDMGGNISEWSEYVETDPTKGLTRRVMGGAWYWFTDHQTLSAQFTFSTHKQKPTEWWNGFRVAALPATANVGPEIQSFNPMSPVVVVGGASQTFSVDAWDADADPLFYIWTLDGRTLPVSGDTVTYSPTGPDIGAHVIEVTVLDDSGGSATQTWAVSVTGPQQPPTVAITTPMAGATYSALSNIVITATASDVDSPIAKVELYQGAVKLGEDLTSPYSFTWSKVNVGTYVLSAKAIDSGGLATVSAPVTVNVRPVVSLSVYDAWASEPTTDKGRFKVSRTGATTAALTVRYAMSGTATNGTDYQSLAGTATIAAGANYVYVYVTPKDDALVEAKESAVMTLAADTAYVLGTTKTGTVNLLDNETPVVTLSVYDAWASEPTTDTGRFRISRTGATTAALAVQYAMSGTATNGTDYQSLASTATIAAGATDVYVDVTPRDDALVENKETVVMTVSQNAAYQTGSTVSGTVNLLDNEMPIVTVAATDAVAAEPAGTGTFTITRSGKTALAVTVSYGMSGTAAKGTDYATPSGTVTLASGVTSTTVTISPTDDTAAENRESITLGILASTAYQTNAVTSATLYLYDNEKPYVTVAVTDSAAAEAGSDPGKYTITCLPAPKNATAIAYTMSGVATNGTDYVTLPGSVTVPAGQTTAVITLTPVDDGIDEVTESAKLTLALGTTYQVGTPSYATVNITDDD